MPFIAPKWSYEPMSTARSRAASEVTALGDQIAPLVAEGSDTSLIQAQRIVQQAQQDDDAQLRTQNEWNQQIGQSVRDNLSKPKSFLGGLADDWRAVVPQQVRDVLGGTAKSLLNAGDFINTQATILQHPGLLLHDDPSVAHSHLGTDISQGLGSVPGVGGALQAGFDYGLAPLSVATLGAGEAGVGVNLARNVGGAVVGSGASQVADQALPEDTNPLVRGAVDIGAGVLGGAAGGAAISRGLSALGGAEAGVEGAASAAPEAVAATAEPVAPDLQARVAEAVRAKFPSESPENIDRIVAEQAAPSTATVAPPTDVPGVRPEGGSPSPSSGSPQTDLGGDLGTAEPFEATPEEQIRAQNQAAYQRSLQDHPSMGRTGMGEPPPAPPGSPPSPLDDTPEKRLLDLMEQVKPLQAQQATNNAANQARQAQAFEGTFNPAAGTEGLKQGLSAMRGAAEKVGFTPVEGLFSPEDQAHIVQRIASQPMSTFDKATAGSAFLDVLNGKVPSPSELAKLEQVVPGITESLQKAGVIKGPSFRDYLPQSIGDVNNAIRTSNTLMDFAAAGRLGPTAGLYDPENFAKSFTQAWHAVRDPQAVQDVWESLDARADASGGVLPTLASMREDYGLRVGADATTDATAGILGKVPVIGRVARWYGNFQNLLRPQMLQTEIENRIAADASFAEKLADPAVKADLGRAINLITGSSSLRFGDNANLLLEFPNWLAAQGELIQKAVSSGSITGEVARTALGRLLVFGLTTTAAINLAQGINPTDSKNFRNGVPMAHVPGTDLTVDMFGPLGELVSKGVGLGRQTVKGYEKGGAAGAAGGAGKGFLDLYRSLASPVVGMGIDIASGTNVVGTPTRDNPVDFAKYMAGRLAPFSASGPLEGREPVAIGLSGLGARVHQPSPYTKLSDTLANDPDYGKALKDLSEAQQLAARADPKYQPLFKALDEGDVTRAAGGDTNAKAAIVKLRTDTQQQASDQKLLAGGMSVRQWQQERGDRLTFQRGALEQVYGKQDVSAEQAAKDPKLALLRAIQQATDPQTGAVDSVRFEQAKAQFDPQTQQALDQAAGSAGTQLEQAYKQASAKYYGAPRYAGYSAQQGELIDRVHSMVSALAAQMGGAQNQAAEQQAFAVLQRNGSFANIDAATLGGVQRAIAGSMPQNPQRQVLERTDPAVAFFFSSKPSPYLVQQFKASLNKRG